MSTETLRMPEHNVPDEGVACRGAVVTGYAHMNPDGTLHCNRCGWVTPEPVITAYSPDTDRTYLSWDELVQAEANGYLVLGTVSRPKTVPVTIGPWPATPEGKKEAQKASARLRGRWARQERMDHGPGIKVTVRVQILWKDHSAR